MLIRSIKLQCIFTNFKIQTDLVKSVGYINIAKQVVKDLISICKSDGSNLTKFVSNSKELLQSILEQLRGQEKKS